MLIASLVGVGADAVACRGNDDPVSEDLSEYSAVFLGEVTGIHLTDYEAFRARKHPDGKLNDEEIMDHVLVNNLDFEIRVLVDREFIGLSKGVEVVLLGGCSVEQPKLKERGVFFVRPRPNNSIAVLESEPDFEHWLSVVTAGKE
jgi:hypothetical protein